MVRWDEKPIKALGRVVTGKTPPKDRAEFYEGGEHQFVSPKDLSWDQYYVNETETKVSSKAIEQFRNQVLPKNSVLFTSLSFAFGKMGITSQKCLTNQQINSIIVNNDNDYKFVYYLLQAYRPFIFSYNSGIDTPIVPKSVFEAITVLSPPLATQRKIAAILSAYDDLIENNKRRIALLEKMAEELYREWFVRFRFRGWEKAEFEKGIPKGWASNKADSFFTHVKGKSYSSEEVSELPEAGVPFVNLKCFHRGGGFREDGVKFYSGKFREEQRVKRGDVVMAVTDMTQNREVVGHVARIPDLGEQGGVISLDVVKLVPKSISRTFLYSYLMHSGFSSSVKQFANGANVLHLKPDVITEQPVLIPPTGLRDRFDALMDPIHDQLDQLAKANRVLTMTRDQLLPRLISGKLSVENLDIQFPPSMQPQEP